VAAHSNLHSCATFVLKRGAGINENYWMKVPLCDTYGVDVAAMHRLGQAARFLIRLRVLSRSCYLPFVNEVETIS
jgi:hypothetical protein